MSGQAEAEDLQDGRGDIHNRGLFFRDLSVGEEHSGNQPRINAMVAAPSFQIVLENRAVTLPMTESQEARNPSPYPIMRSGALST